MSQLRHFTLTEQHIALLRNVRSVGWGDCEIGAPAIDPKRPYGNSDVLTDIANIVGAPTDAEGHHVPDSAAELERLHTETRTALEIVLATGTFQPGEYVASAFKNDWRLVVLPEGSDGTLADLIAAVRRMFDPTIIDGLAEQICSREHFARRLSSFDEAEQEQYRNTALFALHEVARHVIDNRLPEGLTFTDIGIPTRASEIAAQIDGSAPDA